MTRWAPFGGDASWLAGSDVARRAPALSTDDGDKGDTIDRVDATDTGGLRISEGTVAAKVLLLLLLPFCFVNEGKADIATPPVEPFKKEAAASLG